MARLMARPYSSGAFSYPFYLYLTPRLNIWVLCCPNFVMFDAPFNLTKRLKHELKAQDAGFSLE